MAKTKTLRELLDGKKFLQVSPDTLIRNIAVEMPLHHSSAAAVVDESSKLIGLVTERDIVEKSVGVYRNVDETTAEKIMILDPVTIDANSEAFEALQVMTEKGFRTLPVMDGEKIVGIIDIRDLFACVNQLLEEQIRIDQSMIAYAFGESYAAGHFQSLLKERAA